MTKSILPPRLTAPNLVGVLLPLCLGNIPADKDEKEGGKASKDEIHNTLAEALVDEREELCDDERRDPVCRKRPGLGCSDGLGADELRGQDEGHGAQAKGEACDEEQDRDGGEDGDRGADADG